LRDTEAPPIAADIGKNSFHVVGLDQQPNPRLPVRACVAVRSSPARTATVAVS
jgi:hypothetical protein